MESLSVLEIYQRIKKKNLRFLDYALLARITGIINRNTLYKTSQRLIKKKILDKITPGIFMFTDTPVSEFEVANYVYQPSYVSLESALSFYGILPQFVYTVTSITTKKTKRLFYEKKEYLFCKIDSSLFWGYEKKNNILIATPEKALLDTWYFASKGLIKIDNKDLDLSIIDKRKLLKLRKKFKNK
jgi:predicted transcriptional regulator of viral defense system